MFFILFFSVSFSLFCSGGHERLYYAYNKYINGKVLEVLETEYYPETGRSFYRRQNYTYFNNGIIVIRTEDNQFGSIYKSTYICYNEYFNGNINSKFKNNEMIQLAYISQNDKELSLDIKYTNNSIEIIMEHIPGLSIKEHKMTLTFDESTNRLIDVKDIFIMSRWDDVEYNYKYDLEGRMTGIYIIYNWGRVLKTAYYYDGVFRKIERPYYLKHNIPNTDEIVIYDDLILKYHLGLRTVVREAVDNSSIEREEANIYYTVFYYDLNKNEIKQESVYEKNEYYIKKDEIIKYTTKCIAQDDKNNWKHIQIYDDNNQIYREIYREIKYEN
jgi:hypothetical protein